jgi:hypothetical protein
VKKLPAAGIGPDTHSEYSATENWEADAIKRRSGH